MKFVYSPEGEPVQSWTYNPRKVRASEAEMLERRVNMPWDQFNQQLAQGSVLCRRALLWHFLTKTHPTLKFEDVDFAIGELTLKYDRSEYALIRKNVEETTLPAGTPEEAREAVLAQLDVAAQDAEDPEGKAPASNEG